MTQVTKNLLFARISALCYKKLITLGELEKLSGIAHGAFFNWEKFSSPGIDSLVKLANYLNVSVSYLTGNSNDKSGAIPKRKLTSIDEYVVKIPVLKYITSDLFIDDEKNIIDWEEMKFEFPPYSHFFAIKVKDNSLFPRALKNDLLIVQAQDYADSGNIVVVALDEKNIYVRRLIKFKDEFLFLPLNPDHRILVSNNLRMKKTPIKILGRVIELRGELNKI